MIQDETELKRVTLETVIILPVKLRQEAIYIMLLPKFSSESIVKSIAFTPEILYI